MTGPPSPAQKAAVQYLTCALEEIEKAGHRKAARHARIALEELRGRPRSVDKADKHPT
jgi:hypothetical protein